MREPGAGSILLVSLNAFVAELVDALVLGTSIERCVGSTPTEGTIICRGGGIGRHVRFKPEC